MTHILKVKKERIDVLLVEQGFFESRENASKRKDSPEGSYYALCRAGRI